IKEHPMHYSTKHYSCRDVPWRVSTKSLQTHSLFPLPITHYPLPITHYPLPITHYPLPVPYSLFPVPCSLFPVPHSLD
ncbi:MAG: hypothetical protein ACRC2M_12600, partial [Planktothrix sp.]